MRIHLLVFSWVALSQPTSSFAVPPYPPGNSDLPLSLANLPLELKTRILENLSLVDLRSMAAVSQDMNTAVGAARKKRLQISLRGFRLSLREWNDLFQSNPLLHNVEDLKLVHSVPHGASLDALPTSLKALQLTGSYFASSHLQQLKHLSHLELLSFRVERLDEDIGDSLKQLSALKTLSVGFTHFTEAGCKRLGELSTLQELDLILPSGQPITPECAAHLGNLSSLKKLSISAWHTLTLQLLSIFSENVSQLEEIDLRYIPEMGDDWLFVLRPFQKLRKIRMRSISARSRVTAEGIRSLDQLADKLERLELTASLNPQAINELEKFKKLNSLHIHLDRDSSASRSSGLAKLKSLESLTLGSLFPVDEAIHEISNLPQLKSLALSFSSLQPDSLAHLSKLTDLEKLTISSVQKVFETDNSFSFLQDLVHLKTLILQQCEKGIAKLTALTQLKALEHLELWGTAVEESEAPLLSKLTSLHALILYNSDITSESLHEISRLTDLRSLTIQDQPLKGPLVELKALQHLKSLQLGMIKPSDLQPIEEFSNLQSLTLNLIEDTQEPRSDAEDKSLENFLKKMAEFENLQVLSLGGEYSVNIKHLELLIDAIKSRKLQHLKSLSVVSSPLDPELPERRTILNELIGQRTL